MHPPPNQKTEEKKRNGGTSYSLAPAPKPVFGLGAASRPFSRASRKEPLPLTPNRLSRHKLVWGRVQGNMMCLRSFSFPLFFGLGARKEMDRIRRALPPNRKTPRSISFLASLLVWGWGNTTTGLTTVHSTFRRQHNQASRNHVHCQTQSTDARLASAGG